MKNSLIIGFGKRVKNTVIPALKLINDGDIYIYSKTFEKLILEKNKYGFKPIKNLNNNLLQNIQRIFICTPNSIFIDIVRDVSKFNVKKINLYLDTPILPKISNINIEKYKDNFKNVFVLEDFYYNPLNEITKKIINDNNLGSINTIEYIHSGHSYHSLAQSRYLLDKSTIFFGNKINNITNYFFLKSKIIIFGKRSEDGHILIKTLKDNLIINNPNKRSNFKIDYIFDENVMCGYNLNNVKLNLTKELETNFNLLKIICKRYNIKLRTLQEQIISFVILISQCEKDTGKKYYLDDGIKDSFISAVVNKIFIYIDINFRKKSLILQVFKFIFNKAAS
jgi:hypothetical protein